MVAKAKRNEFGDCVYTEADVLEWVYAALDKDATEASLASQIEDQKAPQTVAGTPW